jgi:hypothetical protein
LRHPWPWIAACIAVLGLIAIAGCGSSTTAQFITGYSAAQSPLNRTFVGVKKAFTEAKGRTIPEIARSFSTLADRFGQELPALEALKPPTRLATAFTTLTTSLNRVERDLREASLAFERKDVVEAAHSLQNLQSDSVAATDAATAIARNLDHR